MDKRDKIGRSLICVGCLLMLFGFSMQLVSRVSWKAKNSNNKIVQPTSNPNEKEAKEIIEKIDNDNTLTEQEKEYGRIYASHYKSLDSVTKEDFNKNLKPTTSNDNIVDNEIKTLIAYLNGEIILKTITESDLELDPCFYLVIGYGTSIVDDKENIFNSFYPNIAECMYGFKYIKVDDNPYGGTKIVSDNEYSKFKNYFTGVKELETFDSVHEKLNMEDEYDKGVYERIKSYLNNGYRVAYSVGDGFESGERFFELDGINKISNTNYQIEISIYYIDNDKYIKKTGKFDVEVVDKHLKYGKLVFE